VAFSGTELEEVAPTTVGTTCAGGGKVFAIGSGQTAIMDDATSEAYLYSSSGGGGFGGAPGGTGGGTGGSTGGTAGSAATTPGSGGGGGGRNAAGGAGAAGVVIIRYPI